VTAVEATFVAITSARPIRGFPAGSFGGALKHDSSRAPAESIAKMDCASNVCCSAKPGVEPTAL
jgi:hypothetical protein